MDITQTYSHAISALGAMALLMLVQLLILDLVGIRSRHVPGSLIETDHDNLLFRASRTVANTNESIAVLVLAAVFCIFSAGDPVLTAYAVWGFVAMRALYAIFYYMNLQSLRSVAFGLSLLCLSALLITGIAA